MSSVLSANLADEADVWIGGAVVPANGGLFIRGIDQERRF